MSEPVSTDDRLALIKQTLADLEQHGHNCDWGREADLKWSISEIECLHAALDDLMNQVSRFCAEQGEWEFYTGPALAALRKSRAAVHLSDLKALVEGRMSNG